MVCQVSLGGGGISMKLGKGGIMGRWECYGMLGPAVDKKERRAGAVVAEVDADIC